ncbi:hypothetical protein Q9S36_18220 [Microbacterium sp. ARD31]|uniref:DUF7882 family protein n=1 Tax=Microbacterium TaxID=33882 RepID=UPI0028813EA2|nr:hypothetical protein [Microbacterium sp. ARD31]MDT0182114.1 hypothetical protein [Microbacterium sp. ARD31]
MGRFQYHASARVIFTDDVLAHLQAVVGVKLRRGEAFMLTWRNDASLGDGKTSIWVNAASTLVFKFRAKQRPPVNRESVERMVLEASQPGGLYISRDFIRFRGGGDRAVSGFLSLLPRPVKAPDASESGSHDAAMSEPHSIIRTVITINDDRFELAQGETVHRLLGRVRPAVLSGGDFVELALLGDRLIHVLITAASRVVVSAEPVRLDSDSSLAFDIRYDVDPDLGLGYI